MNTNEIAAESAALTAREAAKHWGDRTVFARIKRDGAIVMVHPESENDDGDTIPMHEMRTLVVGGANVDLGREYDVPARDDNTLVGMRNTLICESFDR